MSTSEDVPAKVDDSRRPSNGNTAKTILFRKYTAQGTKCLEAAFNNVVARVQLERLDLGGLLANKRPQKRKWNYQVEPNGKRLRMMERSRKLRMGVNNSMQRFRNRHYFNGDKRQLLLSGTRVRKPNPKFQDFITTSPLRLNSGSHNNPTSDPLDLPSVKSKTKIFKAAPRIAEQDPLELMNLNFTEPTDDVVRSFLPDIKPPTVIYDLESATDTDDGLTDNFSAKEASLIPKEKTTKAGTKNVRAILPKKIDTSTSNNFDASLIPPTQTTNTPVVLAPHSMTPVIIPQLVNTNSVPIIADAATPPTKVPPKKATPVESQSGLGKEPNPKTFSNKKIVKNAFLEELRKVARRSFKLGSPEKDAKNTIGEDSPNKEDTISRYHLVGSEGASNRTKKKGSDVDFNKLVRTLKSVKLPAANWKIRIVVSRSQTITEVTFTNKEVNERCVKFSRFLKGYIITFGKSVVKLIGAPSKILSYNDVTALLEIVHNLSLNDPVLQYVADKDK